MQNKKLASLLKRHRNIHPKKRRKGRICKKNFRFHEPPSPLPPESPTSSSKNWNCWRIQRFPNRRFWGYCSHLARWCKLWSNLYKMPCSSLLCHVLVWHITVKKLWGFAHVFPNFISRCKFLHLSVAWKMGMRKILILGCKRMHKPGRIFSGFSCIFMELCGSKVPTENSSIASLTPTLYILSVS